MSDGRVDIAIIGMAGRFPGAASTAALWELVARGGRGIRRLRDAELRAAGVDPATPGLVPFGGVLDGIDLFDAAFFGFSKREAELTDPQHRLMLEVAHEAFEDAGHVPDALPGPAGVYVGSALNTYGLRALLAEPAVATSTFQRLMGVDKDFLATRIAYKLGLTGPALSVQTACSTSLVAVALAVQHLLDHTVDFAVAGGVTVAVPHTTGYLYEESGIFSPDGACRAFDRRGAGTVPGNGCGAVVLRRLDEALADGDSIYAIIRGAAINNDGAAKAGYTAPSVIGQARCVAAALADADAAPSSIGLIEAHGTGTQLGDPIEIAALTRVYREETAAIGACAIGSVKSNLGHLNAASGVTGLIKAALALHHGALPPTLDAEAPNPQLRLEQSPFRLQTRLEPWPAPPGGPRRAAVSSFGFGGTNAHAVLEEAPTPAPAPAAPPPAVTLRISAHTAEALTATAEALAAHVEAAPPPLAAVDLARTLADGRRALRHRRAAVVPAAADRATVAAALRGSGPRRAAEGRAPERAPELIFLFPGQGAQRPGFGRALHAGLPAFRAAFDRFAAAVARAGGPALRPLLEPGADLDDTALVQPLLVGLQLALVAALDARGLRPAAALGHSLGELSAAAAVGALSVDDAARLAVARGQAMAATPAGGLVVVWAGADEVRPLAGDTDLAAINGPHQCALSGLDPALAALEERLRAAGLRHRRLRGRTAFHAAPMDAAADRLRAVGARLGAPPARAPLLLNETGDWLPAGRALDPGHWARHARQPVRFGEALGRALAGADAVLVEIGPGSGLCGLAQAHPAHQGQPTVPLLPEPPPGRAAEEAVDLEAGLARLWVAGAPLSDLPFPTAPDGDSPDEGSPAWAGRRLHLPGVALQRQRHWLDDAPPAPAAPSPAGPARPALDLNDLVDVL